LVPVGSPAFDLEPSTKRSGVVTDEPLPIITDPELLPAISKFKSPALVPQVEAAPPVKVNAPPEVKEEALVGVRLTLPAPEAVKLPEASVKAMFVEPDVVMVAPPLYAFCKETAVVVQVGQAISPAAESVIGPDAETATVPEAFGILIVLEDVGSTMVSVVFAASAVTPSKERGEAPTIFPEERLIFPVVTVKPFEAVSAPADVMVPVPVVEMLFEVLIELVVAIEPKPEAMEPEARAPTVVSEEPVTPEARVAPVNVPAAAVTVMSVVPLKRTPLMLRPV